VADSFKIIFARHISGEGLNRRSQVEKLRPAGHLAFHFWMRSAACAEQRVEGAREVVIGGVESHFVLHSPA